VECRYRTAPDVILRLPCSHVKDFVAPQNRDGKGGEHGVGDAGVRPVPSESLYYKRTGSSFSRRSFSPPPLSWSCRLLVACRLRGILTLDICILHFDSRALRALCALRFNIGSPLKMDSAYVDKEAGQAFCVWDAPDRTSIESLFNRAGVETETIREVAAYSG